MSLKIPEAVFYGSLLHSIFATFNQVIRGYRDPVYVQNAKQKDDLV
jgi:hypothetical protein